MLLAQGAAAHARQDPNALTKLNARSFAFSILTAGANPQTVSDVFMLKTSSFLPGCAGRSRFRPRRPVSWSALWPELRPRILGTGPRTRHRLSDRPRLRPRGGATETQKGSETSAHRQFQGLVRSRADGRAVIARLRAVNAPPPKSPALMSLHTRSALQSRLSTDLGKSL
jgi:hypothetical protein